MSRCAIICTGPSVSKNDLSRITDPKIGVNWSFLGTQSYVHVISNHVLIKKHGHELLDLTPETVFRYSAKEVDGYLVPKHSLRYCNWKEYLARPQIPQIPLGYDVMRDGWVFAGGGPCALQVAVAFNYDDIVFVGLDLDTGKNCHFYEPDERLGLSVYSGFSRTQLEKAWVIQASYFRQVTQSLLARGIRIRNTGLSDIFEQAVFEELWP